MSTQPSTPLCHWQATAPCRQHWAKRGGSPAERSHVVARFCRVCPPATKEACLADELEKPYRDLCQVAGGHTVTEVRRLKAAQIRGQIEATTVADIVQAARDRVTPTQGWRITGRNALAFTFAAALGIDLRVGLECCGQKAVSLLREAVEAGALAVTNPGGFPTIVSLPSETSTPANSPPSRPETDSALDVQSPPLRTMLWRLIRDIHAHEPFAGSPDENLLFVLLLVWYAPAQYSPSEARDRLRSFIGLGYLAAEWPGDKRWPTQLTITASGAQFYAEHQDAEAATETEERVRHEGELTKRAHIPPRSA